MPVRLPSGGRDVPVNVRVIDLNADAMDNIMEVWNIRAVFQRVLVDLNKGRAYFELYRFQVNMKYTPRKRGKRITFLS